MPISLTPRLVAGILRFVIEWANKLWQAFLPLGAVLIVVGIQIDTSYKLPWVTVAFWGLSVVCFAVGFLGLIWSFVAIRNKEREDRVAV